MRGKSSPIRSFGFGQRETGGASRSLVSAPAGISATKKHAVLLAAWDRRHCRSEGARFLRWVLRPPGNVSKGRWKRHQNPESDTLWRCGRGVITKHVTSSAPSAI